MLGTKSPKIRGLKRADSELETTIILNSRLGLSWSIVSTSTTKCLLTSTAHSTKCFKVIACLNSSPSRMTLPQKKIPTSGTIPIDIEGTWAKHL